MEARLINQRLHWLTKGPRTAQSTPPRPPRLSLDFLGPEVELLGQHGAEAGHLLLADGIVVGTPSHAAHRHLPVHQHQEFGELHRLPVFPKEVTEVLDVPGAIDGLPVGVVPFEGRREWKRISSKRLQRDVYWSLLCPARHKDALHHSPSATE